jgi:hypothetical protein
MWLHHKIEEKKNPMGNILFISFSIMQPLNIPCIFSFIFSPYNVVSSNSFAFGVPKTRRRISILYLT